MKKLIAIVMLALVASTTLVAAAPANDSAVVNVNTATASELEFLPRIGPALAGRILEFRDANGPFKTVDELVAVRGIGEKSLELLRPYVTTSGETTLAKKIRTQKKSDQS